MPAALRDPSRAPLASAVVKAPAMKRGTWARQLMRGLRIEWKRPGDSAKDKASVGGSSATTHSHGDAPNATVGQGDRLSACASTEPLEATLPDVVDFAFLREQTIGRNLLFPTPFGDQLLTYADYTASGRALGFIETRIRNILCVYGNTHTEDSKTGREMGALMHEAEQMIKRSVNAGPEGRLVITQSTGATGAINKLQQIIGVYLPPATSQKLEAWIATDLTGGADASSHGDSGGAKASLQALVADKCPVVFVGPFEHHSNEVSWRQCLCVVEEIDLDANGGVDLAHLERLLKDERFANRQRIVSISAASNVTGMITPVHEVARLAHANNATCFFDFAASGPYCKIDMNPPDDPLAALDAIFLSPHKFIGGPGSCGVLVFNQRIYHTELAPTVSGGGTVEWVSMNTADFNTDIEEREKAGTPGILQALRAGLVMELKDAIGPERIHAREQELLKRAFSRWAEHGGVHVLGNNDPTLRVGIVSFNVCDPRGRFLHFRLASILLNDLFGIQSRAGCSCAGPYGHRLLQIDAQRSQRMLEQVREGVKGIRPGWCRVGFHFTMSDAEANFIVEAVCFLVDYGSRFLGLYTFDKSTGKWAFKGDAQHSCPWEKSTPTTSSLSLKSPFGISKPSALSEAERETWYVEALAKAQKIALGLPLPSPVFEPVKPTDKQQEVFNQLLEFNLT